LRDLYQIQNEFQQFLLDKPSIIETQIVSSAKVPASQRLDIYRDAYFLRFLEVLTQDFPLLYTVLGDDKFEQLAREYINNFPSTYRSIRWFDKNLAHFMYDNEKYLQQPYLAEIAAFEWALTEAFDASDSVSIEVNTIAAIPFDKWPEMDFKLHPSLRRLKLQWDIIPLWSAFQESKPLIMPEKFEITSDWLIWRNGYDIQFGSLLIEEATMLDAMAAGEKFNAICEKLCEWINEEEVALYTAGLLKRFIMDGLISNVSTSA
jgi:hypothetical protein